MKNNKKYYLENADNLEWGFETGHISQERAGLILNNLTGKKILDIGCGSGIWTDFLTNKGFEVAGIDFVSEFIQKAKKVRKGKFIEAQAEKLPFADKSFDTVLLINVLEHVDDDHQVLKEAGRVGKRVVINVPQQTPKPLFQRGLLYKHYIDRSHQRVYSKKSLRQLFKKAGFKKVKIMETERLPAISVFFELFKGPSWLKRVVTRIFFWIFKEKNYYLELFAVVTQ